MRILFVADGRSPTALNWIQYFIQTGDEVHLASTFPCASEPGLASLKVIPVALSEVGEGKGGTGGRGAILRRVVPVGVRTRIRQFLGPLTLPRAGAQLRQLIAQVQPDLVHAMRIPYEGMVAATAMANKSASHNKLKSPPLLISVWGNDFTLHARSTPWMAAYTRRALRCADALHTDCMRDQRLARTWGFAEDKPTLVLPGGGGVQRNIFYPLKKDPGASDSGERVINPRGFRAYVRNDTFFHAIPLVLKQRPEVRFICPTMESDAQALKWVKELDIVEAVDLLPRQPRPQMADLFRQAAIVVSITTHDGTPNTLLEALACGCFPIAGDIESLREWITPGENGLLVDPGDPQALAQAILLALNEPGLRAQAQEQNLHLIDQKAEYEKVMREAARFYLMMATSNIRPAGPVP
jgi:glycosyltransferase involved in cell wall biosynthesis